MKTKIVDVIRPDSVVEIRSQVIGNGAPITNSGYDFVRFIVDHDAVLPNGTQTRIPAGTLMYMRAPSRGAGYEQNRGVAARRPDLKGEGGRDT